MGSTAKSASRSKARVLVVDDHLSMAEMVSDGLSELGYDTVAVSSGREAARRLGEEHFDALVTDLRMPDLDGIELLSMSQRMAPERPVIVMTAYSAIETAIDSIRRGAYHYLTKPFKVDELALFLARALEEVRVRRETVALKRALKERSSLANLIGRSGAMREVCDLVERLADADVPVLITGETGTGKGVVARAIHADGNRGSAPFVTVNCAALPEALLESELFGHLKGAFTGATSNRTGLFAEADGGSLFLDEIAEMSPPLQAKLLRVLESGEVRAVGSNREIRVNVRVLAATHRNLRARVAEGTFREDLLYRLDVVAIEIPPLRQRREDLPTLIAHFIAQAKSRHPRSLVERLAPDVLARLDNHPWPGNVRELEHLIERLVVLGRAPEIVLSDLPQTIGSMVTETPEFGTVVPLRVMVRRYTAWALEQLGGQKLLTAEKLEIDIKTLRRWLQDSGGDEPIGQ